MRKQRAEPSERQAIRVDRADLVPPVDFGQGHRRRRLHEPEAEQCERRAERDHEQHQRARPLARGVHPQQPEAAEHGRLHERDHDPERDEDESDAHEEPDPPRGVHARGTGQDPPPGAPVCKAKRHAGPPRGASHEPDEQQEQDPDRDQGRRRVPDEGRHGGGTGLDPAAEEVRRAGAEDSARGHCVASGAPALGPRDGLGPLCLEVRAGRAVVERLLQLAPASLERDPRVRLRSRGRVARNRLHDGLDLLVRPEGVVAAHPRVRRAAEVEGGAELVRVAARRGVYDRVRPVDELELLVTPVGLLGALVRAVADRRRLRLQRFGGIGRVEVELDHLPVAFVRVVEVVEDVEEPVLEGDLARMAGFGGHVRVDGRRASASQEMALPVLVVAAGTERAARVVEVVLETVDQVLRARADLHQVGRVPGPAQRDGRLAEQQVDVERDVRLSGAALHRLLDEAHDRAVLLRERVLVSGRSAGAGGRDQSGRDHEREQRYMTRAYRHAASFDARRRIPLRLSCCSPSGPAHQASQPGGRHRRCHPMPGSRPSRTACGCRRAARGRCPSRLGRRRSRPRCP